jgi:DNA primase
MATDTVQQIKDRLSIVDVVSQYVKLDRAGTSLRARCPFHAEKTPSFHVSPERGTYHCFGCGVGGDIFSFVESIEGLDFKGALKVLAERAGVEIRYERGEARDERARLFELLETASIFYASRLSDEAKQYLAGRGVTEGTMQAFRIGEAGDAWGEASEFFKKKGHTEKEIESAGLAKKGERGLIDKFRNRIMFPIADPAGRIVGFSGRTFGAKASPDAPKYLNSPETPLFRKSHILYGFDRAKMAIRKHNFAVLVEGQMDLVLSHQAGWGNTIAVSGTAFTAEHAALIRRMSDNLVLALDADEAGIKAAGRAARAALQGGLNVKVARLPNGLDPADLIMKDADGWRAAIRDSKDIITFLLDVLEEHAKTPDNFRRTVEAVVLPFVGDIQSPIAREQHMQEIAKRLGVSAGAVSQAFSKVPLVRAAPAANPAISQPVERNSRARLAFAIFLWQSSVKTPLFDVAEYEKRLRDAIGDEVFGILAALPEAEHERLRHTAEAHAATVRDLSHDTEALLSRLIEEKLAADLVAATNALREAEAAGDEALARERM